MGGARKRELFKTAWHFVEKDGKKVPFSELSWFERAGKWKGLGDVAATTAKNTPAAAGQLFSFFAPAIFWPRMISHYGHSLAGGNQQPLNWFSYQLSKWFPNHWKFKGFDEPTYRASLSEALGPRDLDKITHNEYLSNFVAPAVEDLKSTYEDSKGLVADLFKRFKK